MKTYLRQLASLIGLAAVILIPPLAVRVYAPERFVPWAPVYWGLLAFGFGSNYVVPFKKLLRRFIVWVHAKTKLWTTVLMIAALLAAVTADRAAARPSDEPPQHDGEAIAICVTVLVVGGIVVWGIWKMCSRIPPPPPAETIVPPPTNYPNINVNPVRTNRPTIKIPKDRSTMSSITSRDISQFHMPDPVSDGFEFHTYWFTRMEVSENLAQWRESLTVTGYVSDAGQYVGFWSNGVCLYNAYVTPGGTNDIPIEQGTGLEKAKFFRAVVP